MTTPPAVDEYAEKAVLGSLMLLGEPRAVQAMVTRGLRPEHFYWKGNGAVFAAAVSLCDRQSSVDAITVWGELERLGIRGQMTREQVDDLVAWVPAAGHSGDYCDRVVELARWRDRQLAVFNMEQAVARRDPVAWAKASADLEDAVTGTRTATYSPEAWANLLWDYFSASPEETNKQAIPWPFAKLNDALGGGMRPGEVCAFSGATSHGKSMFCDQCLDAAAKDGKRCHLYMTEMTALARGMRYLARRTGVPFLAQRRNQMTDHDRKQILDELAHLDYGCTVAAGWDVDDIVRDALRARYDLVAVDLLHGFHYEDERGLDRLSKAMQKLARVSTTLDGHAGTAVIAVTHLKEEGIVKGKVPRPTLASIKGGASIKQDADMVAFVWQDQDDVQVPTGDGEIWLAKGRTSGIERVKVRLDSKRFKFVLRAEDDPTLPLPVEEATAKKDIPF